jgi:hypothetical protein
MNRSERATSLLRDEFFMEEIERLKQIYVTKIVNSSAEDIDGREQAYRNHSTIEQIISHFQSIADDAKINEKRWKMF